MKLHEMNRTQLEETALDLGMIIFDEREAPFSDQFLRFLITAELFRLETPNPSRD